MAFRVGIMDISAAVLVVIAIAVPDPDPAVQAAYDQPPPSALRDVAVAQAGLAAVPGDGEAAEKLAAALRQLGQLDWAAQVGGASAEAGDDASAWRGYLAASIAHAERVDVAAAHRFAKLAVDACKQAGDACPDHRRVKLDIYFAQLDRGLSSGIDPRAEPQAFEREISKVFPTVDLGKMRRPAESENASDNSEAPTDQP